MRWEGGETHFCHGARTILNCKGDTHGTGILIPVLRQHRSGTTDGCKDRDDRRHGHIASIAGDAGCHGRILGQDHTSHDSEEKH